MLISNFAGGKGLLPESKNGQKDFNFNSSLDESWMALEAARNNYFSIAGSKA